MDSALDIGNGDGALIVGDVDAEREGRGGRLVGRGRRAVLDGESEHGGAVLTLPARCMAYIPSAQMYTIYRIDGERGRMLGSALRLLVAARADQDCRSLSFQRNTCSIVLLLFLL